MVVFTVRCQHAALHRDQRRDRDDGDRCERHPFQYKLRAAVDLADVTNDFDVVALSGPDALSELDLPPEPGAARPLGGGTVFTDLRIAEMGARAILAAETGVAALASEGFTSGNPDDCRNLRLTLGLLDGSHDIVVEKNFPLECGFEELNAIDYEKGCYVGQELTARTHHRGKIRKRLMPVVIDGPLPEPGTRSCTVIGKSAKFARAPNISRSR